MLLPAIARANYNKVTQERIPAIKEWCESSELIKEIKGTEDWGIIVSGESEIIVKEALKLVNVKSINAFACYYISIARKKNKSFC